MTNDTQLCALVVDDEPRILTLASRAFAKEGIKSDTAADGEEALSHFRAGNYDLVLTDLRMPNMHGHALILDLLELDQPPKIFVATSVAEPRLVKDLLARGVEDVEIKPVDFRMLAAKIRSKMDSLADGRNVSVRPPVKPKKSNELSDGDSKPSSLEEIESYLVSSMTSMPPELLGELINLQPDGNIEIPTQVESFAKRLSRKSPYANNDRRMVGRVATLTPVLCVPYDENFQEVGVPFHVFLRDISTSGIGIISLRPINDSYLALAWTSGAGQGVRTFAEVLRCRSSEEFFDVGCRFVDDL